MGMIEVAEAMYRVAYDLLVGPCDDCGKRYPHYWAAPRTWAEAGLVVSENVCVLCLGRRLQRDFTPQDFLPCPANDWLPLQPTLRELSAEALGLLRQLDIHGAHLKTGPWWRCELYRNDDAAPERVDPVSLMELNWGRRIVAIDSTDEDATDEDDLESLETRWVITDAGREFLLSSGKAQSANVNR